MGRDEENKQTNKKKKQGEKKSQTHCTIAITLQLLVMRQAGYQ